MDRPNKRNSQVKSNKSLFILYNIVHRYYRIKITYYKTTLHYNYTTEPIKDVHTIYIHIHEYWMVNTR